MSKQSSSKSSKVPAIVPTARQVMSQEELRSLGVNDGSSSFNTGLHPGTSRNSDEDDLHPKEEDDDEEQEDKQEDNPVNPLGTYASSSSSAVLTANGNTANVSPPTIIRYGGGPSGLFGDTSIPSTITAMPKLAGSSAHLYNDWKLKATNYFSTNGLAEVATMEPISSLELAVIIDGGARPKAQIKALWVRLNSRVYGAIRSAVETIIGTSFFEEIESDTTALTATEIFTAAESRLNTDFKSGCAYYLWDGIRRKLEQFTPHDLSRLVERYMNLKYTPRSNPIECRTHFDNSVRELKLAGLTLPDKLHLAVWYKALPPELDSLRQALGAKSNLQWKDIYEAIVNQYSSKKASRNTERSDEKAHAALESEKKRKDAIRFKRDKNRNNLKSGGKPEKHCNFCERDYHDISECRAYKGAQASVFAAKKAKKTSDSEADEDHAAVFVEDEVAATFQPQSEDELAAIGKDSSSEYGPIHFLFDSGATTHVTPVKHILNDINNAPIMTMSTAISGQRSVINKRGKVRLNDKWTLRDVAYVPQASSSLISEGRLCDAGYEIYKNKDYVLVRKNEKTVLRGVRANRLWVYTVNGTTSTTPRPIDTLVASKPPPKQAEKPDQPEEKTQSSTQPNRRIPKKGAPKPAAAGGASSSSQ